MGIDPDALLEMKSNLAFLGILVDAEQGFKFKRSFVYFFFLAKYFSDRIADNEEIRAEISRICDALHIKENSDLIIFLSYHSNHPSILQNIFRVGSKLFDGVIPFEFKSASVKAINNLVSEVPKMIVQNDAVKQRERILEQQDASERRSKEVECSDIDPAQLTAMDYVAHANLAYRTTEIMGQLLKNHWATFSLEQKKELYKEAMAVSMRCLNVWVEHLAKEKDELAKYVIQKISEKNSKNLDAARMEKQAKRMIFTLSAQVVFCYLKVISQFTGVEDLKRVYDVVLKENPESTLKILTLSIKMDFFDKFPIEELVEIAKEYKSDQMIMRILAWMVRHRLYMRPIDDFKLKQRICDAVGVSVSDQLNIQKRSVA